MREQPPQRARVRSTPDTASAQLPITSTRSAYTTRSDVQRAYVDGSGKAAASESGALDKRCEAAGRRMAADTGSDIAETASGAFESGVDAAGDASAKTASGAFDSIAAFGALESVKSASGAFESDETAGAPSGAFDAVGGIAIGTHAALWPPSQCARWQRAPQ